MSCSGSGAQQLALDGIAPAASESNPPVAGTASSSTPGRYPCESHEQNFEVAHWILTESTQIIKKYLQMKITQRLLDGFWILVQKKAIDEICTFPAFFGRV